MKKGIFFALLFGALFLLLFSLVVHQASNASKRQREAVGDLGLHKHALIADDISFDLKEIMQIRSVRISRDAAHAYLFMNETLPSGYLDPSGALLQYAAFIQGRYAERQNLAGKLILDLDEFSGGPFIYFDGAGINYSYSDPGKENATLFGPATVEKFSLQIGPASSDVFQDCGWEAQHAGSLEVEIIMVAQNCPSQSVLLDPSSESVFWANSSSGKFLRIAIGDVDGHSHSLKIIPDGIPISNSLNVTVATSAPITAWMPVALNFSDDYILSTLIIAEN
ncbi:MAG: hypothetical protein ABH863_03570 [Candidatus Micrarchaeota archaeon]